MERVLVRRECDEGVVAAASSMPDVHAHFIVSIFFGLLFSWLGVVLFIVGQQSRSCTHRESEDDDDDVGGYDDENEDESDDDTSDDDTSDDDTSDASDASDTSDDRRPPSQ